MQVKGLAWPKGVWPKWYIYCVSQAINLLNCIQRGRRLLFLFEHTNFMDAPERVYKNYLLLGVVQKGRHRGRGYPKMVTNELKNLLLKTFR